MPYSCCPPCSRRCTPCVGVERLLLPPPPRRSPPLVLRLMEPGGRRHGSNGHCPFLCVCTYSSSSSSSAPPPPPPPPSFFIANTTSAATAPVTASGATVVTTTATISAPAGSTSPVVKKRKRYRKAYPGEIRGIVEEMRFVAMRLRNDGAEGGDGAGGGRRGRGEHEHGGDGEGEAGEGKEKETWQPSMEGFLKYLVDSKLIFETIERTVDHSEDVAYAYFRKTGLERSYSVSKDLDWFSKQGIIIPNPGSPGTTYATYLCELAESSAPSFLCHLYNIYFAHATGGQAVGKQVCEKLLEGCELEFYKWEEDVFGLLQGTREKLNKLAEHWSRDDKNRCLRESAKCFRFLGQIVHLIIL